MTIHHARPDAIDRASGLADGTIYDIRALRPEFMNGAEECRVAVLTPENDLGLSQALRMAIARRVALTADNEKLLAEYPVPQDAALACLSRGEMPEDDRLAAIAAHTDMIAANPGQSSRESLDALLEAGLAVPQVIALSELLAFACFQIRVAHGLNLLEQNV